MKATPQPVELADYSIFAISIASETEEGVFEHCGKSISKLFVRFMLFTSTVTSPIRKTAATGCRRPGRDESHKQSLIRKNKNVKCRQPAALIACEVILYSWLDRKNRVMLNIRKQWIRRIGPSLASLARALRR